MSRLKKTTTLVSAAAVSLALAGTAFGDSCPTDLKQNEKGYWYSDSKPGWKSHKTTGTDVTLSADHFGGVIYSPKRKRVACVYKASNGQWIALVSNVHHGIVIDKQALNDSGHGPAWQYNKKHDDYACGYPNVTHIDGCQFDLTD